MNTLEMFSALHVGAPFGHSRTLEMLAFVTLGNAIGGLGFVTVLRLVQVGSDTVREQRSQSPQEEERRAA